MSSKVPAGPREVTITKSVTGFGFNVRGQVSEGGQLKSINGQLYAPLQHVSAVLDGGAAYDAGIRKGDRILEVNNVNVEGSTHKQVVDLIKSGGDVLTLTVISVTPQEAERLEPSDDQSTYNYIDYSDKRSLPISIPDYHTVDKDGDKYVVYNIYMAGRHLCSKRYSEFANLHANLKREFIGYSFPKLTGKWPFTLSEQQLDKRRRGLELYLEKICAVRVIAECEIMQDFLADSGNIQNIDSIVDLKIILPDREIVIIRTKKNATAESVYNSVVDKIQMVESTSAYFYLFEIVEYNFERKIQPNEIAHQLYVQNYRTASASCLCIKRWVFNPIIEMRLVESDTLAATFIFWSTIDEVDRNHIVVGDRLYELKALQDSSKKLDYLKMAKELPGYGEVIFPHCPCDSRKTGHVMASVGYLGLRLIACTEDGTLENQIVEFTWKTIKCWEVDETNGLFSFQFQREDKSPKCVKLHTPYFTFLADCFNRIQEELWKTKTL